MKTIVGKIHNGKRNPIKIRLTEDGVVINHSLLTRAVFTVGTLTFDSQATPQYFDFTNADKLLIKLGGAGIPVGTYSATVTVFDTASSLGLAFGDDVYFRVEVI